jgi:hypothetical protein
VFPSAEICDRGQLPDAGRSGAGELWSLLGPDAATAREDPKRGAAGIVLPSDDRGIAVGRDVDREALRCEHSVITADEFRLL